MELQYKKRFLIELTFAFVVTVIVYFAIRFVLGYLLPFVIATPIAYFSHRLSERLHRGFHLSKGCVAAISAALIFTAFFGLAVLLIYLLSTAFRNFLGNLGDFVAYATGIVSELQNSISDFLKELSPDLAAEVAIITESFAERLRTALGNTVSGAATGIAKAMPSFLLSSVVALVASCYIAKDFEGLARFVKELMGKRIYDNILKVREILVGSILKLLKGYLILATLTFAELTAGLWILRVDYAPLVAFLIALVDLLPVFGTGTILVPWGIARLLSGDIFMGISLILLYAVIMLVRNFLEPKIIGKQIGINPLFTLVAMFAGLKVFGFWGLLICPITLIVVIKYYKNEMQAQM